MERKFHGNLLILAIIFTLITSFVTEVSYAEDTNSTGEYLQETLPNQLNTRLNNAKEQWNTLIVDTFTDYIEDGQDQEKALEKFEELIEEFKDKIDASKDEVIPSDLGWSNKRYVKSLFKTEQKLYKELSKQVQKISKDLKKKKFDSSEDAHKITTKHEKKLAKTEKRFDKMNNSIHKINKKNDYALEEFSYISFNLLDEEESKSEQGLKLKEELEQETNEESSIQSDTEEGFKTAEVELTEEEKEKIDQYNKETLENAHASILEDYGDLITSFEELPDDNIIIIGVTDTMRLGTEEEKDYLVTTVGTYLDNIYVVNAIKEHTYIVFRYPNGETLAEPKLFGTGWSIKN